MAGKILYETPGGGVAVVIPAPSWGATLEELALKTVPPGANWRPIEDDDLPDDREGRHLWRWSASGPVAVAPSE
ncbi:MAG: hypothetical protein LCH92_08090 [Proteobacteria bacterium]|nr:hypothetical protein [Pseudomonadota bacterium]